MVNAIIYSLLLITIYFIVLKLMWYLGSEIKVKKKYQIIIMRFICYFCAYTVVFCILRLLDPVNHSDATWVKSLIGTSVSTWLYWNDLFYYHHKSASMSTVATVYPVVYIIFQITSGP